MAAASVQSEEKAAASRRTPKKNAPTGSGRRYLQKIAYQNSALFVEEEMQKKGGEWREEKSGTGNFPSVPHPHVIPTCK
jgi:hypothetical protein